MILCIDIGNSRTTFALLKDGKIRSMEHESSRHLSYKHALMALRRLCAGVSSGEITAAGVASVVPFLTTLVVNAAFEATGFVPVVINGATAGIPTSYDKPDSIGADRMCNAAAAYNIAHNAAIVIDWGRRRPSIASARTAHSSAAPS